ncbi:hypothetical protein K2Y00_01130 [Patescibacteria group bacterium]|nr:hypothetical protein [Patescibacteria group bacterium]
MNIEDLSKSQLLLLTVLVNFVTAIATAVLTVSLLDEAPTTVTQTVNRIVENTIETVTTQVPVGGGPSREEELLTSAISASAARSTAIHRSTSTPAIASATYLPISRAVATARVDGLPKEVVVAFPDGSFAEASLTSSNDEVTIYGFSDTAFLPDAPAASPAELATLLQGQTVISMTAGGNAVTGIISKIEGNTIYTSLPVIPAGTAAVLLGGGLMGISTGVPGAFVTADSIMALLTGSP